MASITQTICRCAVTQNQNQIIWNSREIQTATKQEFPVLSPISRRCAILTPLLSIALISSLPPPPPSLARDRRSRKVIPLEDYLTSRKFFSLLLSGFLISILLFLYLLFMHSFHSLIMWVWLKLSWYVCKFIQLIVYDVFSWNVHVFFGWFCTCSLYKVANFINLLYFWWVIVWFMCHLRLTSYLIIDTDELLHHLHVDGYWTFDVDTLAYFSTVSFHILLLMLDFQSSIALLQDLMVVYLLLILLLMLLLRVISMWLDSRWIVNNM